MIKGFFGGLARVITYPFTLVPETLRQVFHPNSNGLIKTFIGRTVGRFIARFFGGVIGDGIKLIGTLAGNGIHFVRAALEAIVWFGPKGVVTGDWTLLKACTAAWVNPLLDIVKATGSYVGINVLSVLTFLANAVISLSTYGIGTVVDMFARFAHGYKLAEKNGLLSSFGELFDKAERGDFDEPASNNPGAAKPGPAEGEAKVNVYQPPVIDPSLAPSTETVDVEPSAPIASASPQRAPEYIQPAPHDEAIIAIKAEEKSNADAAPEQPQATKDATPVHYGLLDMQKFAYNTLQKGLSQTIEHSRPVNWMFDNIDPNATWEKRNREYYNVHTDKAPELPEAQNKETPFTLRYF